MLLPLREEISTSTFNETKAWTFFTRVEGDPYGHDKTLFAWLDTEHHNYFEPFSEHLVPFIIKYME